jgi:hypothetical protein
VGLNLVGWESHHYIWANFLPCKSVSLLMDEFLSERGEFVVVFDLAIEGVDLVGYGR